MQDRLISLYLFPGWYVILCSKRYIAKPDQVSPRTNTSPMRLSSSCITQTTLIRVRSTSTVLEHSLSGTISTTQAIIVAVGKPFMAKLADVSVQINSFKTDFR
jgi:hypothetical protein